MTETTPAYLATPPDAGAANSSASDARDWLKAQLKEGIPEFPSPLRIWLDALPWRLKAVVVLSFVDHMTQEEIGYRLCITPRTVYSDLQQVYILVEGAGK